MDRLFNLIAVLMSLSLGSTSAVPQVSSSFKTSHPGFITLARNITASNKTSWNIIISRFNGFPFSTDYVSLVRDIGSKESQSDKNVEDITDDLHWPNEPGAIPENVFQRKNMVVIPSGFLVPTKGKGALTIYDLGGNEPKMPHQLTDDGDGDWFYHRAVWMDMDGDGKDDVVTCRAQKPIFGEEKGEMLWLKHPDGENPWTSKWRETILVQGDGAPDTFLIPVKITVGDRGESETIQVLITAGFFSKSLDIWWRKEETQPWTKDNINKRIIDKTEGAAFDLIYADINNDHKSELLVTYNKPSNGTMFVYEFSADLRSSTVKKHMILSGIDPAKTGVGKGAPGGMKLAWPNIRNKTSRPDIILSGDDNGKLYMLRAGSASEWQYTSTVILDASPGTMGAMAVGDIDNDNYTDIIAPSYDENTITLLTYKPSAHKPTFTQSTPQLTSKTNSKGSSLFQQAYNWIKLLFP